MNQAVLLSSGSNQMLEQMSSPKSNSQGTLFAGESDFSGMLAVLMLNPLAEQGIQQEGELELEEMIKEFFHFIEEVLVEPTTTSLDNTEQEELVDYLSKLIELFDEAQEKSSTDEDTLLKNYEELYSLFQQLPIVASGIEKNSDTQGKPFQENGASQAVAKWNMLLQAIRQQDLIETSPSLKTNSLAPSVNLESAITQSAPLMASLLGKWKQDPEWLAFLKQKLHTDSATKGIVAEVIRSNPDYVPRFSTQMPMSLLLQALNGEQGEGKTPPSDSATLANKADSSAQLGLEQRTLPLEAKGNERVAESKPTETPVPSARFAHLMDDLKGLLRNQLQGMKQGEDSQIRIKIFPEHLGHLDIRISSIAGKISAQLMASHQMAKEALEFGLGQLRVALTQQGIQVDRIEVTQQNNTQGSLQEQKSGQQFFQRKEQGNNSNSKSVDTLLDMEETLNNDVDMDGNTVSKINYVV
jgi:flagellar hook-length control protein FliK